MGKETLEAGYTRCIKFHAINARATRTGWADKGCYLLEADAQTHGGQRGVVRLAVGVPGGPDMQLGGPLHCEAKGVEDGSCCHLLVAN